MRKNKNKILIASIFALASVLMVFGYSFSRAQVAPQIGVSAFVTDGKNELLQNKEYDLRFALYRTDRTESDAFPSDADAAGRVWMETQKVYIRDGVLSAYLGSATPLPASLNFNANQYYLGIRINSDSEFVPRKKVSASPLAINAFNSAALGGATLGNKEGNIAQLGKSGKFDISLLPTGTSSNQLVLGNDSRFDNIDQIHLQNTDKGTSELVFTLGTGSASSGKNFDLSVSNASVKPALRFNGNLNKWQYSNDGQTFTAFDSSNIDAASIERWNNAFGWGDHSAAGYITDGNTNWDNSYNFITANSVDALTNKSGNISMWTNNAGYLTSYAETDPNFSASASAGITGTNITNWNSAFGWGNHATNGYLTASSTNLLTNKTGAISMWTNDSGFITASSIETLTNKTWNGNVIAPIYGGTGLNTFAVGDMLFASNSTTLSRLGIGTAGQVLMISGGIPMWSDVAGATPVVHDMLSSQHGDVTEAAVVRGGLIAGQGLSATWSLLGPGTNGQLLRSNGAGADLSWVSLSKNDVGLGNVENTALSTWNGSINIDTLGIVSNGTWHGSTVAANYGGTGVSSYNRGDILFYDSGVALSKLGAGLPGQALVISGGVPTWSSSVPTYPHNLLNGAEHPDSTNGAPVRGDLIVGNVSNLWARLAHGTSGDLLTYNGADVVWNSTSNLNLATLAGSETLTNKTIGSGSSWQGNAVTTTYGGTGLAGGYAAGDLLYYSSGTSLNRLARQANGTILSLSGGFPSWMATTGITTLGTITSGTWNGTVIDMAHGGTGASTQGGARTNLGIGSIASLNSVDLTSNVSGILPLASGGTNSNNGSITGSGALTFAAGGTNTNINLNPNGSGIVAVNGALGISAGSYRTTISGSGSQTADINYILPTADGGVGLGHVLKTDGNGNLYWEAATGGSGGAGTVTSVASGNGLTGGPITTMGTLSINLLSTGTTTATRSSNSGLEFVGASNQLSLIHGCVDNEVLSWNSSSQVWQCASVSGVGGITGSGVNGYVAYWTGGSSIGNEQYLSLVRGGTGAGTALGARANLGLAIGSDVQAYNAVLAAISAGTWTGSNSITTVGTIGSGTWNGGIVSPSYGGTGIGSYAAGDILYANGANTLTTLSAGAGNEGRVLVISGGIPTWSASAPTYPHNFLNSSDHPDTTTGVVERGDLITGQGASATWSRLAHGSAGSLLSYNGSDIVWNTVSALNLVTTDGTQTLTNKTIGSGSSWQGSSVTTTYGGTGLTTFTAGDLLYYNSGVTLSRLARGADGTVLTLSGGIPVWSASATAAPHNLLNSVQHPDTTTASPVRGALIAGQGASTTWSLLGPGTSGQLLRSNGAGADLSWVSLSKNDVGLGNVENTALSTWNGSSNISSVGTINSGIWNGSAISPTYLGATVMIEGENISLLNNNAGYITDGNTGWDNSYGFITDGNTNWDNSYGFITDANDTVSGLELDGVFSTTGILTRTGAATYATITDNSANWNSAYGWGNHGSVGYLIGTKVDSFNTRTGAVTLTSADVTGALTFTPYNSTNPAGYITASSAETLTNKTWNGNDIDISDYTNLATSGSLLTLASDTLSINAGTLTNGRLCTFVTGTGFVCDTDVTTVGHSAVTLGTANGLSLSTQQLSLGLASSGVTGALSGTDWNTFNSKQAALNGTGFVKISGTTITYDNSTYVTGTPWTSMGYLTSFTELDPIFAAAPAAGITGTNITNWNSAFGWGNHASVGYITDGNTGWDNSYGFITASSTNTLTNKSGNISMWTNNAGYLTSFSELDPVYLASSAATIAAGDITNWNSAYGWGNHGSVGYLIGTKVDSFNTRTGAVTLTSADVTGALTFTPYNSTNPAGYITASSAETLTNKTWNGNVIGVNYGGTGTNSGSITGTGALTFAAGGTNTNINLNPNGSGMVVANGPLAVKAGSFNTIFQGSGSQTANITYTLPSATGTSGQVLKTDDSGNLYWATVSGGSGGIGTVTSVASGNGLTGGPITETGTLSIGLLSANGGNASTSSFSGLQFSGTLNNQLSLLQGCADNEVLAWNNTTKVWQCSTVSGVGGITGSGTTGQVVVWSGTNSITAGGTLGSAAFTNSTAYAAALGADDNYVTDAQLGVIANTSGTNTGDNAVNSLYSGLAASKQNASTNLSSLAGLTYGSSAFVKMTGANTFTLDTNTYVTGTPWTSMGYLTAETDPRLPAAGIAGNILQSNGTAWTSWTPNYLTSFTETDPIFIAAAASGITGTNITNWNSAFGWGNHAGAGYITDGNTNWDNSYGFITDGNTGWDNSYGFITDANDSVSGLELDGVFSATGILTRTGAATYATITDNSVNWNSAFGWGNHASVGYLTASSTNTLTNKSGNISMWTNDSNYITDGNTNWDNSYGFITASSTDTLTNKTWNGNDIDISDYTNLATSGSLLTLASDTLSINAGTLTNGRICTFVTGTGFVCDTDVTTVGHSAVTLGTANGLSLSTQQLSLGLASSGVTGALSGTDWNTFNSKQAALNGTGFVKISGTTISYDNSTYVTGTPWTSMGYLTSFTELDPIFAAAPAAGIIGTNITNWNSAYGWGNHATQNYFDLDGAALGVTDGGTGTATQFTQGSLVFAGASGVYSEDNANLFWDDAINAMGIGTMYPTSGFRASILAGSTDASTMTGALILAENITGDQKMAFGNKGGAGNYSWIQSNNNTSGFANLALNAAGGNVGIGTTSPAYKLSVVNTTLNPGNVLYAENNSANPATVAYLRDRGVGGYSDMLNLHRTDAGGSSMGISFYQGGGSGDLTTRMATTFNGGFDISTNASRPIYLSPNSSIAMTLLGSGNVGIGDTTPASLFTVGTNDAFQINNSGQVVAGAWNGTAIGAQYGGTGLNTSASTGIPTISAGTWSVASSLGIALGGTNATTIGAAGTVAYSTGSAYAFSALGTSGQAMVSGGAGAPTWFAPTTGSILFAGANGILSQNSSNFFWDNTSNFLRLGNGTQQFSFGIDTDNKFKIATGSGIAGSSTFSIDQSGTTTIASLEMGAQNFAADSGSISWIDMPVTSGAANGMVERYIANLDGNPMLTIYGTSDGAGGTSNRSIRMGAPLGLIETGTAAQYYTYFQGGDQAADITYTLPTANTNGVMRNTGGVLSWDNTSYLSGTVGVTSGGTGTATQFTPGSMVFAGAGGVYSQDNANLFWDDAINAMGIGTMYPSSGFRATILAGSTDASTMTGALILAENITGDQKMAFGNKGGAGNYSWIQSNNNTSGFANLALNAAGGNVGIGTTAPTSLFSVGATSQFQVNNSGLLRLYNSTGASYISLSHNGTNGVISTNTGSIELGSGSGNLELSSGVNIIGDGDFSIMGDATSRTIKIGDTAKTNDDIVAIDASNWSVSASGMINGTFDGVGTKVVGAAVTDGAFTGTAMNGLTAIDSSNGRYYFRYGGAWHYVNQTGGFQIPNYEVAPQGELAGQAVVDASNALPFEKTNYPEYLTQKMNAGDLLIPYVDSYLSDGAVHGLYARFDDVKQKMFGDEQLQIAGLSLKTDSNVATLTELKTSVDQQLGIISTKLVSNDQILKQIQDTDATTQNTLNSLTTLTTTLQTQIDQIKAQTGTELNIAQIDLNTAEISMLKTLLGITENSGNDIAIAGKLKADTIEAGKLVVSVNDPNARTIGQETISSIKIDENVDGKDDTTLSDGKSYFVRTTTVTSTSKIFVTPKIALEQGMAVTEIRPGEGFTISVKNPVTEDVPCDWVIVEEK